MKTYDITINTKNYYIVGLIRGAVSVLTSTARSDYPVWLGDQGAAFSFDATEEQAKTVNEYLVKFYPDYYMGMKVVE